MVRSLSFELQGSVQLFLSYKEVHSHKVVAVAPLGAIVTGHLAAVAALCHLVPPGNPRDGCASISGPSKVVPESMGTMAGGHREGKGGRWSVRGAAGRPWPLWLRHLAPLCVDPGRLRREPGARVTIPPPAFLNHHHCRHNSAPTFKCRNGVIVFSSFGFPYSPLNLLTSQGQGCHQLFPSDEPLLIVICGNIFFALWG